MKHSDEMMTITEVAQKIELSYRTLLFNFLELHVVVRQAVQEQEARIKALQKERWRVQIDEAATQLIAQGEKLSGKAILKAVGLRVHTAESNPVIQELLKPWIGGSVSNS